MQEYRIVAEIAAHEGPVRSLCVGPLGEIVSGSQDSNVRRWALSEKPEGETIQVLCDEFGSSISHNHWIPALISLSPGKLELYSDGCIITGCQDCMIRIFDTMGNLLGTLKGHEKGVISFSWTNNYNLISGSWDGTARVWDISTGTCIQVLGGHENGVHVLGLPDGSIATTSTGEQVDGRPGNYFLRFWDINGKQLRKPRSDHTGSLRAIAKVDHIGLVTAANDGSIIIRTMDGEPISVHEHELQEDGAAPFILDVISLDSIDGNLNLVSCGENGSVMVWDTSGRAQSIPHPTCCWCACALPGGDFVTAGHDGTLRIFSKDLRKNLSKIAQDVQSRFTFQVEESLAAKVKKGMDSSEIARSPKWDDRAHYTGRSDGEHKIFNRNGAGIAAQWSATSGSWIEIGEIVGSSGDDDGTINGKTYDHVMPVEVDTSTGPMKLQLGYNTGENPFVAAQRFIDENMLNQGYLSQVADWITARTGRGGATPTIDLGATPSGPVPLVGMPTGSSSYSSSSSSYSSGPTARPGVPRGGATGKYIPLQIPITFEDIPSGLNAKIIPKIESMNASTAVEMKLNSEDMRLIAELTDVLGATSRYHVSIIKAVHLNAVLKMLNWSKENIFPSYDILRMTCAHPAGTTCLIALPQAVKSHLMSHTIEHIAAGDVTPTATSSTAIRFLCNLMKTEELRRSYLDNEGKLLESMLTASASQSGSANKVVRASTATLIANIVLFASSLQENMKTDLYAQSLSILYDMISSENENIDVIFRSLMALGTVLSYGNGDTKTLVRELEFSAVLKLMADRWKGKLDERVNECYAEVISKL
eukprot:gene6848-13870_t